MASATSPAQQPSDHDALNMMAKAHVGVVGRGVNQQGRLDGEGDGGGEAAVPRVLGSGAGIMLDGLPGGGVGGRRLLGVGAAAVVQPGPSVSLNE